MRVGGRSRSVVEGIAPIAPALYVAVLCMSVVGAVLGLRTAAGLLSGSAVALGGYSAWAWSSAADLDGASLGAALGGMVVAAFVGVLLLVSVHGGERVPVAAVLVACGVVLVDVAIVLPADAADLLAGGSGSDLAVVLAVGPSLVLAVMAAAVRTTALVGAAAGSLGLLGASIAALVGDADRLAFYPVDSWLDTPQSVVASIGVGLALAGVVLCLTAEVRDCPCRMRPGRRPV
jgi:hypothetical protein